jgi:probable HAF family extracellular repeat protein
MKSRIIVLGIASIALAAGCSGGGGTAVPQAPAAASFPRASSNGQIAPQYSVVELPSLGGSVSVGGTMNQQGVVAGVSSLPGDGSEHAVMWRGNRIIDLGTLGGPNSFAQWINDQNSVSVISDTTTPDPFGADFCGFGTGLICRGFVSSNGTVTALPTLGGNNAAPLFGYNDRGQVVGVSETAVHDPTCPAPLELQQQTVVWGKDPTQLTVLSPLPGDTNGQGGAMNENGDVAGGSGDCTSVYIFGGSHAVLWRHGVPSDLGNLGGTLDNAAFGINNLDDVSGHSDLPGDATFHGFLWHDGVMSDLGTLPGDAVSTAPAINNTGLVAGFSCRGPGERHCQAVIWKNGSVFNLNDLIPPTSPLFLVVAFAVNDADDVTGWGIDTNTGNIVAYLATPTGNSVSVKHVLRSNTELSARMRSNLRRLLRPMHREFVP